MIDLPSATAAPAERAARRAHPGAAAEAVRDVQRRRVRWFMRAAGSAPHRCGEHYA
jgi:hypothetical protein